MPVLVAVEMKILFVWSGLSGYMGDCWRELSRKDGVELKVAVDLGEKHIGGMFRPDEVMRGLDWHNSLPDDFSPDVVFLVGWHNSLCRSAAFRNWGSGCRKVICFDMPWEWRVRKFFARFALWRYLRMFDAAFIPGVASEPYARWLGFRRDRIFKGMYGTDVKRMGSHIGGRGFLFVGRDAPEKGLDVLRDAHGIYKANGGVWDLRIVSGVSPDKLGQIYREADCFILPSLWEPWGVVLAEAAAAGLPIICTDKCGARHEVVKGNGIVVPAGDIAALAAAMCKISRVEHVERVEVCELGVGDRIDGELGRELAKPYSCEAWAERVIGIADRLMS